MPDHVPQIDGRDPSGAYCYGYIETLLDALVPRPDCARRRHRRRMGALKFRLCALSKTRINDAATHHSMRHGLPAQRA
jgi:hypothetical protein